MQSMITYDDITVNNSLRKIAITLGYYTEKSTAERTKVAKARVCSWKRTGIPARVQRIYAKELVLLATPKDASLLPEAP